MQYHFYANSGATFIFSDQYIGFYDFDDIFVLPVQFNRRLYLKPELVLPFKALFFLMGDKKDYVMRKKSLYYTVNMYSHNYPSNCQNTVINLVCLCVYLHRTAV